MEALLHQAFGGRPLSARELEVLRAAGRGLTVAETAQLLGTRPETVKQQRKVALAKLGARNIAHAIALAYETGVLGERRASSPSDEPIREGQLRAFHGKAGDLDRVLHQDRGTAKRDALEWASETLGREIESANDLTSREASLVLDHLEALLEIERAPA